MMRMLKCRGIKWNEPHSAPADQFPESIVDGPYDMCAACRAKTRRIATRRAGDGHRDCSHHKPRNQRACCSPASALGYATYIQAQQALGIPKVTVSSEQLLCCSRGHYASYISLQFRDGMMFSNYKVHWDLEYIVPILQLDTDGHPPDQATIISRFHYTNARPGLISSHAGSHLTDDELATLLAEFGIES